MYSGNRGDEILIPSHVYSDYIDVHWAETERTVCHNKHVAAEIAQDSAIYRMIGTQMCTLQQGQLREMQRRKFSNCLLHVTHAWNPAHRAKGTQASPMAAPKPNAGVSATEALASTMLSAAQKREQRAERWTSRPLERLTAPRDMTMRPEGELGAGGTWKSAYSFELSREPVGPGGIVLSKTRATDKPDEQAEQDPKVMATWSRQEKIQFTYNFLANRVLPRMREAEPEKAEQVARLLANMQPRVEGGSVSEVELMPLMEGAVTAAEASHDFKMENTVAALGISLDSVSKDQLFAVINTVRSDYVRLYNMMAMVLNEMILVSTDTAREVARLLLHGYENEHSEHNAILEAAKEKAEAAWVTEPPRRWTPQEAITRVDEMAAAMVSLANTAAAVAEQAPLSLTQTVTEKVLGVGTKERGVGQLAFSVEAVHVKHAGGGLEAAIIKAAKDGMSGPRGSKTPSAGRSGRGRAAGGRGRGRGTSWRKRSEGKGGHGKHEAHEEDEGKSDKARGAVEDRLGDGKGRGGGRTGGYSQGSAGRSRGRSSPGGAARSN